MKRVGPAEFLCRSRILRAVLLSVWFGPPAAVGVTREDESRGGRTTEVAAGRPVKSEEDLMRSLRPSRCCSERPTAIWTSVSVGKSR